MQSLMWLTPDIAEQVKTVPLYDGSSAVTER